MSCTMHRLMCSFRPRSSSAREVNWTIALLGYRTTAASFEGEIGESQASHESGNRQTACFPQRPVRQILVPLCAPSARSCEHTVAS